MEIRGDYDGIFRAMRFDAISIGQDKLNIDGKERSNLFPWKGQFSPQLVEVLLRTYARSDDMILDPFLGSGTVLCEAGRLGHPCFGTEINPAAFKMAQTYRFINVRHDERRRVVMELDSKLQDTLPDLPIFSGVETGFAEMQRSLTGLSLAISDERAKSLLDVLIVLLDFHKNDLTSKKVFVEWSKLKAILMTLPFSEATIDLANADARALPLPDDTIDLVITSPPYINVFNYHQQFRASVEALGWDLLKVARSEIGSNRKHRGNRFLTVIQYCLDMTGVLLELRRVCKPSGRVILVVGRESNVRKTQFFNGELVAALGVLSAGLNPLKRQERVFKNKFGTLIYEDILHFTNDGAANAGPIQPLEIAKAILVKAMDYAPEDSKADLNAALLGAIHVSSSPIYVSSRAETSQTLA